ncbi:unnamed protein product [Caenorhabditis brenneri]
MAFYQNPKFKGTDYDRRTSPSFSDLPIEIHSQILKELDPIHRIVVRHVTKPLRSIVDSLKYMVAEIEVHEVSEGLKIIFDKTQEVLFSPFKTGCTVSSKTQKTVIEGGNYLELALGLLESILSNPRLRLYTLVFSHHHDAKVFNYCINTLNKKIPKIETKELAILAFKPVILEPILSLVSHEKLKLLKLEAADEPTIEEVMGTELFKMVPGISISKSVALDSELINRFLKFSFFSVRFHRLSINEILDLINKLSNLPTFDVSWIRLEEMLDLDEIAATFAEEVQEKQFIIHRFQIPNSEYRLEIKFKRYLIMIAKSVNSCPSYF